MSGKPYLTFKLVMPTATGGTETIEISKKSVYRLVAWNGIESVDSVVNTLNNANVPGAYVVGKHTNPRRISIEFAVDDKKVTEELRQRLIRTLNPERNGVLYVERNNKKGKIDFVVENAVTYQQANIHENKLKVLINLICPDPYFRDEEDTTTSTLSGAGNIIINNSGDVGIGVITEITANGGNIVNPQISHSGKWVKVIATLANTDKLIINTRQGYQSVRLNDVDIFSFDRASDFFTVEPGTGKQITVSAESGVSYARASIKYANRWLGV